MSTRKYRQMPESDDAGARAYRSRRRNKLLEDARENLYYHKYTDALAAYLVAEQDLELLDEILRPLHPSLIPPGALPLRGRESLENPEVKKATAAIEALYQAAPLFKTLVHASNPSESLTVYANKCLEAWIDAWSGVTKWITYLLMHASKLEVHTGLVSQCTNLLTAITVNAGAGGEALKEELRLMPCSIDVLFILLGQIDNKTKQYIHIQDDEDFGCSLMRILRLQVVNRPGGAAIEARLLSVTRATRRALIAALVDRAQQFVSLADGDRAIGVGESMLYLIYSVTRLAPEPAIWKELQRQAFLTKYSTATLALVEKALARGVTDKRFWKPLSQVTALLLLTCVIAAPDPPAALAEAFDAGLFLCMLFCLPYSADVMRVPGYLPPRDVMPYLRDRRVYGALSKRGDLERFYARQGLDESLESVCKLYQDVISVAQAVLGERRDSPISLCFNLNHATTFVPDSQTAVDPARLKTCSKCHIATYCSQACQEEDWAALHNRECRAAAAQHYQHRRVKATPRSLQVKMDYIAYVEQAMNVYSMNPNQTFGTLAVKKRIGLPYEQGLPVFVFDFVNMRDASVYDLQDKKALHLNTSSVDREWGDRIERCIAAAEEDIAYRGVPADSIMFVESTFVLDQLRQIFVFAKMKMDAEEKEGRRWKAVASVFRVGKQPVLMPSEIRVRPENPISGCNRESPKSRRCSMTRISHRPLQTASGPNEAFRALIFHLQPAKIPFSFPPCPFSRCISKVIGL
ncbi:hypothetical protein DFP72DRAFT_871787 [Ephemerocybe angulata]|uniref:MYND-type domain-containing protein n=1 Tax=Ephemerocybe angulata TaxID=980116 RepID=A0A8H6MDF4_9AGAR|nr:hypothetical protein DFP72DRAFT_871787 [Tulosesus angulatus]